MKDLILRNGGLSIVDGDFELDESDAQNCELLIRLSKGNIKQHPTAGYGEERLLNGVLDARARRDIQQTLQDDGYLLNRFSVNQDGSINIEI
jgi:hypothetical protein